MHTTLRFKRHSRENGNPESLPHLDSRFRGSDDSSLRLKAWVCTIPVGDIKDTKKVGSQNHVRNQQ